VIKDLVCDVSWNFQVNQRIPAFQMRDTAEPRFSQAEADRVQEFRKCIECFLCQDVCHVLREREAKEQCSCPGGPYTSVAAGR
jgi:succinate dehydrogenase / fumarate reductase iron-sulfur subunit